MHNTVGIQIAESKLILKMRGLLEENPLFSYVHSLMSTEDLHATINPHSNQRSRISSESEVISKYTTPV